MIAEETGGEVLAPAKVNLCLHVTGQRADGYHLLDTLVAFGGAFDRLKLAKADGLSLVVEGPEDAGVPADASNLVLRAARIFARGRGAAIALEKHIPAASGVGGGSTDAAAAIRGVLALWGSDDLAAASDDELRPIAEGLLALGADVPMCLVPAPLRARGIGERIDLLSDVPPLPVVLVNPRIGVSTPEVFRRLGSKNNPALPQSLPEWKDVAAFCDWLSGTRNDLEAPAIALVPEIAGVRDALLASEGALFARMSGSGATCFAIYPTLEAASATRATLARDHPDWWLSHGWLGDQTARAAPRIAGAAG